MQVLIELSESNLVYMLSYNLWNVQLAFLSKHGLQENPLLTDDANSIVESMYFFALFRLFSKGGF